MSTLLYLTGQIDNPFFINEISDFTKAFERVVVVAYAESCISNCQRIASEYGFEYVLLSKYPHFIEIVKTLKLFAKKEVREEISYATRGRKPLRRVAYITVYLLNAVKTRNAISVIDELEDVYVYSFWLSRGAFSAVMLKEQLKPKKVISRAHGYDVYEERSDVNYLPFRKYIIENLDEIHFISDNGYKYCKQMCFSRSYEPNKLCVTRLGTRRGGTFIRDTANADKMVIVSCSSIIPLKRLDLIIRVIKKIREYSFDVKWIHIGDGPNREAIERFAKDMLESGFSFMGNLSNSDVYSFYESNQVDFFINMSDTEGVPVSIMEAISFGIPAIARNVGGNSEIVNEKNGILVENINENIIVEECADEVINLFQDKGKYELIAKQAKEYWSEYYDIRKNNQKIISAFENRYE